MTIDTLIEEMKEVKQNHPALEISDVLRIFNIDSLRTLSNEIQKLRFARW